MKNSTFSIILERLVRVSQVGLALVTLGLIFSGLRVVDSDQVALVLRFGSLQGKTPTDQIHGPGLLFTLPPIIDTVISVPVGRIHDLTIETFAPGFQTTGDIRSSGYAVTGDLGLLTAEATAKYRITDPVAYALTSAGVDETARGVISSAINRTINATALDGLLTAEKSTLAKRVIQAAQKDLDKLKLGITLTNLEFRTIEPPKEVKADFDRVNDAAVSKETEIKLARQYREELIPAASSAADRMVRDAQVNAADALSKARDDVAEFNGMLAQYKANPELVLDRVWAERMSTIMGRLGTKYALPQGGTPKLVLP